uniref:actin-binding LIM protein 2 isoform X1 n=1 Tax=Doryrhamphus excisus TaxID=161450 RepID=UPI0025AE91E8|nr:actin-binding LIM protein 2 isoform X1 [Doryrhamphus excisus]
MPEENVIQPQAVQSPVAQQKPGRGPIACQNCGKPCKGEALRVQNKHFHLKCFVCKVCGCQLANGGFFLRQGEYMCTLDYQRLYGTRCFSCQDFIEGEVVSALGKTYHPQCFVCASCKQPFPAGGRVTFNGKECICQNCSQPLPVSGPAPVQAAHNCCGCGKEFTNEQSLVALDKHWHLGCFKCKVCNKVLNAEYISKDGIPYCEMDYHAMFGIQCESCRKYITGKVLEAGEKHYHPSCARCTRCEQMFAEGEEMYLQGSSIWHPPCRQAAKQEEKSKVTRTSSESITSVPASSASGSPNRVIYAKLGEELLDYKDLAALPKTKAIYNIDRPDMLSYSPYVSYPAQEATHHGEGDGEKSPCQMRPSSPSSNSSLGGYGRYTPSRSPQNSRPGFKQDSLPDTKARTSLHLTLPSPDGKRPLLHLVCEWLADFVMWSQYCGFHMKGLPLYRTIVFCHVVPVLWFSYEGSPSVSDHCVLSCGSSVVVSHLRVWLCIGPFCFIWFLAISLCTRYAWLHYCCYGIMHPEASLPSKKKDILGVLPGGGGVLMGIFWSQGRTVGLSW